MSARTTTSIESSAFMFAAKRVIGDAKDPYLMRWIILQTPWFSVYVHKLLRSDHDMSLHDHPWPFASFVLTGYEEAVCAENEDGSLRWWREVHGCGDVLLRRAGHRHRVIIRDRTIPGWTVVLTGPRSRRWGFWPKGPGGTYTWCHWKSYDMGKGICEAGPIAGRKGLD